MSNQAIDHGHPIPDGQIQPDVAGDAAFRAAVRAGIASFEAGPTFELAQVEAELRSLIHDEG